MDPANASDTTGQAKRIVLYATLLVVKHRFHAVGVAPMQEFGSYDSTF